jgi:hypothetical protein
MVSAESQVLAVTRARHSDLAHALLEFPTLAGHRGGGRPRVSDRAHKRPAVAEQNGDLVGCPQCGEPLQPSGGAGGVIGFRLFAPGDAPTELPQAVPASIRARGMNAGPS